MLSLRLVVLCAVASASLIAAPAAKTGVWAEYAGGTIKDIPSSAYGTLNFDDAKKLTFNYDLSDSYNLPYARITDCQVAQTPGHKMMHVSIPKFMTGGKRDTLSITFRDDSGVPQMLTFTMSPQNASLAQSMLSMRVTKPDPAQAAAAKSASPDTDGAWADKVWKTSRNQATWPTVEADKQQPAQQQPPQQQAQPQPQQKQ
jgi:hypothetical protein